MQAYRRLFGELYKVKYFTICKLTKNRQLFETAVNNYVFLNSKRNVNLLKSNTMPRKYLISENGFI